MDAATLVISKKYARRYANQHVLALKNRLAEGAEPAVLTIVGDSTGNANDEWFYLLGEWIADQFPAYTVYQRLWSEATQSYSDYRASGGKGVIHTGAAGQAYTQYTAASADHWQIEDVAGLDMVGDIDIRMKVNAVDWANGASSQYLLSKVGGSAGSYTGWRLYSMSTGVLRFQWSADGADLLLAASSVPMTADGEDIWVRCTLDVDNGSGQYEVKFYTSTDGNTWTQLGTTTTGAAATSVTVNNEPIKIGAVGSEKFIGKIYEVEIRDGVKMVASPDFGMAFPAYGTAVSTFKDVEGNTITRVGTGAGLTIGNGSPSLLLLNGSVASKTLAYSAAITASQLAIEPQLLFISYGHNEGTTIDYHTDYLAYCAAVLALYPTAGIVCVAQNPQTSASSGYVYHNQRCRRIAKIAASQQYGLIDAYTAFVNTGAISTYVEADGVHPNAAGSALWRDAAIKFLAEFGIF